MKLLVDARTVEGVLEGRVSGVAEQLVQGVVYHVLVAVAVLQGLDGALGGGGALVVLPADLEDADIVGGGRWGLLFENCQAGY